ncbi:MAG: type II and III secretion system protein family protein [Syntrophorhabdales bacterium]
MRPTKAGNQRAFLLISLTLSLLFPTAIMGADQERVSINAANPANLTVGVGKSVILDIQALIKEYRVDGPEIADIFPLGPHEARLMGKTPGVTFLRLLQEGDRPYAVLGVEVTPDMSGLKMKLHEILPDETGIKVTATQDSITLSGTVSGPGYMTQALALVQSYAPRDREGRPKVVNLLEIAGVQQVMIEVRVSEMSRTLTKQLGFNFSTISSSGKQFGVSTLNSLTSFPSGGFPANPLSVSSSVNGVLSFLGNGATWTAFIDALQDNGLLRVLAEPTLITLSGKSANFLAGGEFPVPVPQPGITAIVTIQYKPFGVGLNFTPTVLSDGRINMIIAPEVSELDFSQAVSLQGYIIPSITTRRVSTTVELADGQSFAIAGLLQEEIKEDIQKFPLLGSIPILGALFRSSSFTKSETELVILVTPHLVKPLDLSKQTLPTDAFVEPDDFEFYLEGRLEGRDGGKAASALPRTLKKGGLEGDFGYILPGKEEER